VSLNARNIEDGTAPQRRRLCGLTHARFERAPVSLGEDNRREFIGLQAGATDQGAVNVWTCEE
jgi:hypothetical protein